MARERSGSVVVNPGAARFTRRRDIEDVTAPAPPQTVQELAAAIIGVVRSYRETRGMNGQRDATLALAIADRENFRFGRS
jgi:hypothetical protein